MRTLLKVIPPADCSAREKRSRLAKATPLASVTALESAAAE
jgi:hypothetical protein